MKSNKIQVRSSKKERFQKICKNHEFTMNLVLEKYIEMVCRENRIRTEEWSY